VTNLTPLSQAVVRFYKHIKVELWIKEGKQARPLRRRNAKKRIPVEG
jgi:hypothetical protein